MSSINQLTMASLRKLRLADLEPWMVYAPWRTVKGYNQRRMHQRVDNVSSDFRGWRVSVESNGEPSPLNQDPLRQRLQKSFYFGTLGSFEEATTLANAYRDSCELQLALVPWRQKKLAALEDAFSVSGIVLNAGKRAPFWIYRQNGRRIIGSIAQLGLRGAYVWLAERVAELENTGSVPLDVPMPLFTAEQRASLQAYGCEGFMIDAEEDNTRQWAIAFVNKKLMRTGFGQVA